MTSLEVLQVHLYPPALEVDCVSCSLGFSPLSEGLVKGGEGNLALLGLGLARCSALLGPGGSAALLGRVGMLLCWAGWVRCRYSPTLSQQSRVTVCSIYELTVSDVAPFPWYTRQDPKHGAVSLLLSSSDRPLLPRAKTTSLCRGLAPVPLLATPRREGSVNFPQLLSRHMLHCYHSLTTSTSSTMTKPLAL
uniref:Uncharacterized protein n=1 Tax=Knipowitschia caucasica TaxID=637954 RepID=A0AAV2JVW2_KNICA